MSPVRSDETKQSAMTKKKTTTIEMHKECCVCHWEGSTAVKVVDSPDMIQRIASFTCGQCQLEQQTTIPSGINL